MFKQVFQVEFNVNESKVIVTADQNVSTEGLKAVAEKLIQFCEEREKQAEKESKEEPKEEAPQESLKEELPEG